MCVYINNTFEIIERYNNYEDIFSPSIFCKVKASTVSDDMFTLGVIYRSPNSSHIENDRLNKLIKSVASKFLKSGEKLILLGDFNFPDICWLTESSDKPQHSDSNTFLNTIHECYLTQFIKQPTHFRAQQTPTLIDLILSNDPDFISNIDYNPPFGKSHHCVITFDIDVYTAKGKSNPVFKYLYNKGDYDAMREYARQVKWNEVLVEGDSIDQQWSKIESVLNNAKSKFIPLRKVNPMKKQRSFHAPPTLLNLIQLKRSAFKTWKKYPTDFNYNIYVKYRNKVKREANKAKCLKEQMVAKSAKINPKMFYQYVKSKTKPKENISSLLKDDGKLTENDKEKAEVLNNYFSSVFTKEDKENMPIFKPNIDKCLYDFKISEIQMFNALKSLNINKSPGPDGIHPRLLKELADILSTPLTTFFNRSLVEGKIPTAWKKAEVRPIFKKGSKTSPGNYRPVSLTSIVCKLYEGFIRDKLFNHLIENNLLSDEQFGFCKGRSCVTQLLNTLFDWLCQIDDNIPIDAIYLDFRKAFDTVPHERLLNKLYGYGVRGNIFNWVKDFLSDRFQYVTINDQSSSCSQVTSGVPQGSVLGPTLFIYFINDLPTVVTTLLKIFADDTKVYHHIRNDADREELQHTIEALVEWSNTWQLKFNGGKCKVLHIGKNNPQYEYFISEDGVFKKLESTTSEKDLGIFVDPLLSFEDHINSVVKRARSISGLIIRTITFKSKEIMVPLFKALVRPILEYGNVVWCPKKKRHIELIESVQRNFSKCIIGMRELNYEERLKALKLPSLEFRRLRGDLIETYKILNNHYDPLTTKSLLTLSNGNTRSHNFKLLKPRVNTNQFLNFYSHRVINKWNSLPSKVVEATSINCFKNRLDHHFMDFKYATNFDVG